jgi:hypothetical protein
MIPQREKPALERRPFREQVARRQSAATVPKSNPGTEILGIC